MLATPVSRLRLLFFAPGKSITVSRKELAQYGKDIGQPRREIARLGKDTIQPGKGILKP